MFKFIKEINTALINNVINSRSEIRDQITNKTQKSNSRQIQSFNLMKHQHKNKINLQKNYGP